MGKDCPKCKTAETESNKNEELHPGEILRTVVYMQEAIINVLEAKGIADRAEIMEEVKKLVKGKC
jgi:hypothetical protein